MSPHSIAKWLTARKRRLAVHCLRSSLAACLAWGAMHAGARADVLIGTNDERFVGKVIEETSDSVVFESELGGRLTLPRARIRELQRTPPASSSQAASATNQLPAINSQLSTNAWLPPGIGHDGSDWIQLKSGEWLRGRLKYLQQQKVEFDSDELEEQSLKLKDVRQLYPAEPMWAKFEDRDPAYGAIVLSNGVVSVSGPEQLSLSREQLMGITPSGVRGMREWSGKLSAGLTLQSGNTKLTTLSTSGELARRTPNTRLLLDYLGNYSQANGVQNANNERVNLIYDIRLDRHWFVRPAQLEYYHDPLANIALRATAGVGAGYYFFDSDELEWRVSAGPAYQYTQFNTVEPGQSGSAGTAAAVLQSYFKLDITRRLTLIEKITSTFTDQRAGQYTHHAVSTLEFEIKHHLNLDVSFIWDYLNRPHQESNGDLPQKSDYYLAVGVGVRF